ncbi:hypothetical protein JQ582_30300 [Bradyrhizobium japonicum]|uniref:hypothetical protein n=1 Tax=Bradyrhizobium japonicum TaxID=375 RepID=UPI001BA992DE|nr:hypothetical protein [Bradyrhizobium japonicum]MBR0748232.1 hypothetical protein [Bradyrhizobium japonicum]
MAWPIWRAQFLIEIWPTESWNAYWQDAAAAWSPLYPAPESLIGNNYPPLSFYAVGILGKLLGLDNLFVGRALSFVALGALAIEVFAAVRLLTVDRIGAVVAALWYVAIMARNSTIYIGADDPQLAGLAIMGAGLVAFIKAWQRQASPMPALLLIVLAGFWKHNNIAIPITAVSWLWIMGSGHAYRATIRSIGAVFAGLCACVLVFGINFIPNLLATRQYAWSNVMTNIGHLQWSALAFLIWAAWVIGDRRSVQAKFTALHILVALAACILQWLGHGVSGNAEFDFIFALAICIGVTFNRVKASYVASRLGTNRTRDLIIVALLLRLLAADRQETALLFLSDDFRSSLYQTERNVLFEAKQVAAIPGDVGCATKLICRAAGKRFAVDEFKMEELVATGRATTGDISSLLASRGVAWVPRMLPTGAEADTSFLRWLGARAPRGNANYGDG